ncbi:MAG: histidinol-phosphatase HisJ [Saprospiraceae bacterium]
MQLANHHAHSHHSDGRLSPVEYLAQAIQQGLKTYGFSDHAPIPGSSVGIMPLEDLPAYLVEIENLKDRFADQIEIYKGLEVDYIPGVISMASDHIQQAQLDYIIGAVHFVDHFPNRKPWGFEGSVENFEKGINEIFGGDIQAAVKRYYQLIREMVTEYRPNIVAHLDRIKKLNKNDRFFSESSAWYKAEVLQTLEVIAASGVILEVNTKGLYKKETTEPYPGKWALSQAREMNIPVHLSSDAHHPEDITKGFEQAAVLLQELGYEYCELLIDDHWQAVPLKEQHLYFL